MKNQLTFDQWLAANNFPPHHKRHVGKPHECLAVQVEVGTKAFRDLYNLSDLFVSALCGPFAELQVKRPNYPKLQIS